MELLLCIFIINLLPVLVFGYIIYKGNKREKLKKEYDKLLEENVQKVYTKIEKYYRKDYSEEEFDKIYNANLGNVYYIEGSDEEDVDNGYLIVYLSYELENKTVLYHNKKDKSSSNGSLIDDYGIVYYLVNYSSDDKDDETILYVVPKDIGEKLEDIAFELD